MHCKFCFTGISLISNRTNSGRLRTQTKRIEAWPIQAKAKFVTCTSFDARWKHRWKPHVFRITTCGFHLSSRWTACIITKQIEHKNNTSVTNYHSGAPARRRRANKALFQIQFQRNSGNPSNQENLVMTPPFERPIVRTDNREEGNDVFSWGF